MIQSAPFLLDDSDLPPLREVISNLARIGYSEKTVLERLGLASFSDLQWRATPMYQEERLAERNPLALAIELFLLQGSVSEHELSDLFVDQSSRDALIRTGLLAVDDTGRARARASLFPVGKRLFFSDHAWPELPHPGYKTVPYDQVMFVGGDSRALAHCTPRRPVHAALDLCTGSGIQALLAAEHAERVVAVDINERAARCTRFNGKVSGATNLEVVVGDLFEPLREQRFDLITANPPFVPSPLNTLGFRDGGRSGEDIQKRIVAGLPNHLAPGGSAHMITELGERDNEPLAHRLREWLAGSPMDIHILRLREFSATKYAIGHAKGDDYDVFLDSVQSWAGNLRAQGYQRVVVVLISFQWSDPASGPSWVRVDDTQAPQRAAGAEIEAAFQAERLSRRLDLPETLKRSWLRRTGPIALLDAQLLGAELRTKTNVKATLLGQALPVEYQLDPLERELLNLLEKKVAFSDLLGHARQLNVSEDGVLAAITSLLRRRLICSEASSEV
jgi:methylase of polypeptide subunit release factors